MHYELVIFILVIFILVKFILVILNKNLLLLFPNVADFIKLAENNNAKYWITVFCIFYFNILSRKK